ncbi:MAG: GGDEF domain-containing protein [Clostridia bacterium]|nr:GGDEF domain-containing protein [Clostridia bacterium]
MSFFMDFLHQKVPRAGREIPAYYRRALVISDTILIAYFVVCSAFFPLFAGQLQRAPLWAIVAAAAGLVAVRKLNLRMNMVCFTVLCAAWVFWNVYALGWSSGTQHFLTLLLVLVFFNVYDKPVYKIIWFVAILVFRIWLFSWSQQHTAVFHLDTSANTIYQTINTVGFFIILAALCIVFSTSIQDTERQLRLRNQTLYKEAGTDPLTGLPNRRSMVEKIEKFRQDSSGEPFCIAIADLDFFKNVNDTYGHNCGDYTLVKLTELFTQHAGGHYSVCRWGGEEFCFFLPNLNIDEAGVIMNDLCFAVERMKLSFEGHDFSITITIGVEENDYSSPLEDLLKGADTKLYMGKKRGRNQVVC